MEFTGSFYASTDLLSNSLVLVLAPDQPVNWDKPVTCEDHDVTKSRYSRHLNSIGQPRKECNRLRPQSFLFVLEQWHSRLRFAHRRRLTGKSGKSK